MDDFKPERLYPEIPLYFKYTYGGPDDQPGPLPDNVFDTRTMFPMKPLVIYGYAIVSNYKEDRHVEREAWVARKNFLSNCFSEVVPEEEFNQAKANGWQ